jgi:hypothetical protein
MEYALNETTVINGSYVNSEKKPGTVDRTQA